MKKELILVSNGINWTWYCHVRLINSKQCEVLKEYRLHDYDELQGALEHPKITHGTYRVIENSLDESWKQGRIAKGIAVTLKNKPPKNYLLERPVPLRYDLERDKASFSLPPRH